MALASDFRPLAAEVTGFLTRRARWSPLEIAFWLVALASIWLFPAKHLILTEICIWAMFALSLDLILGYAGIISLGHAAFFGLGAYTAALITLRWNWSEPISGLFAAAAVAALAGAASGWLLLRYHDVDRVPAHERRPAPRWYTHAVLRGEDPDCIDAEAGTRGWIEGAATGEADVSAVPRDRSGLESALAAARRETLASLHALTPGQLSPKLINKSCLRGNRWAWSSPMKRGWSFGKFAYRLCIVSATGTESFSANATISAYAPSMPTCDPTTKTGFSASISHCAAFSITSAGARDLYRIAARSIL